MNTSTLKYILIISMIFLCFILFNSWQNDFNIDKTENKNIEKITEIKNQKINLIDKNEINVETDLISAKINLNDGNISKLLLKKYYENLDEKTPIKIFNYENENLFLAQLNLFNDNREKEIKYSSNSQNYEINQNKDSLVITLNCKEKNNLIIKKIYVFKNYSYTIDIFFYIKNINDETKNTKLYGAISREYNNQSSSFFSSKEYKNIAMYSEKNSYKKINTNDKFFKSEMLNGGWIASIDNYFISALIPNSSETNIYKIEKKNENIFTINFYENIEIIPKEIKILKTELFAGPKIKDYLNKLHKGLDLSIDYGILWPIAIVIFLLLNKIYIIINNWGISIIIITLFIKILFFQLSSISYMSLGKMKKLQPKLDLIKEKYGENKRELSQAMLELYKNEKVNPLSGCLPIIIQIPVFISLYYVLLESIELRHSPFLLWITDLSSKDKYYILPIIMSITMFIQQKLNPPIQDQTQRTVMMFMPFLFLIVFLQFPSGLILYWIINNILSILQQWIITKNL